MNIIRPSMNALRIFEAAARLESFSKAAIELNVTSSAVSQQIRALETRLGCALFSRHPNGILLTAQGRRYAADLSCAFLLIDQATSRLRSMEKRNIINLQSPASFASQWLAPRIDLFRQLHPDIGLEIISLGPPSIHIDAEIRYGRGDFPKLGKTKLMSEQAFPVCSPRFAKDLVCPRQINVDKLLHVRFYNESWDSWLNSVGIHDLDTSQGSFFDQSVMAISAAVEGKGILLGRSTLIESELASGLLVAPFQKRLIADGSYWLLIPPGKEKEQNVIAFKNWLLSSINQDNSLESGPIDFGLSS